MGPCRQMALQRSRSPVGVSQNLKLSGTAALILMEPRYQASGRQATSKAAVCWMSYHVTEWCDWNLDIQPCTIHFHRIRQDTFWDSKTVVENFIAMKSASSCSARCKRQTRQRNLGHPSLQWLGRDAQPLTTPQQLSQVVVYFQWPDMT